MTLKKLKIHSLKVVTLLLSICILMPHLTNPTYADEAEDAAVLAQIATLKEQYLGELASDPRYSGCEEKLTKIFDLEVVEFLKFLDGTLQNKSSTESLVNYAIVRYRQFKINTNAAYSMLEPPRSSSSRSEIQDYNIQYNNYLKCGDLKNKYNEMAKKLMIERIKDSNVRKKTAKIMEKTSAMNSRLAELNLSFARMYGNFSIFNNKLSGFIKKCVKG